MKQDHSPGAAPNRDEAPRLPAAPKRADVVFNGGKFPGDGYRAVSFEEGTMEVSPIIGITKQAVVSERATFQRPGAVIVKCEWRKDGSHRIFLNRRSVGENAGIDSMYGELTKKHPWLENFLTDRSGRGMIPESVVPPGEYLTAQNRRAAIDTFLHRFGLNRHGYTAETFTDSPREGITLLPRARDFDLSTYIARSEFVKDHAHRSDRHESWFHSDGRGRAERMSDVESQVFSRKAVGWGQHRGRYSDFKPGIPSWGRMQFAIRIIHESSASSWNPGGVRNSHKIDVWDTRLPPQSKA